MIVATDSPYFVYADHPIADGRCSVCSEARLLHIGRDAWLFCDECQIRCKIGSNLLSTWRQESDRHWRARWGWLQFYRDVEAQR